MDREQIIKEIDKIINTKNEKEPKDILSILTEKELKVLKMRFEYKNYRTLTYEEIGKDLGVTSERELDK